MTEQQSGDADNETSTSSYSTNAAAKPKRPKRIRVRRPKVFTKAFRHRLTALGRTLEKQETTDENLQHLIDSLSKDLQGYQMEAQHWLQKYMELKESTGEDPSSSEEVQKRNTESTEPNESAASFLPTTSTSPEAAAYSLDPYSLLLPTTAADYSSSSNAVQLHSSSSSTQPGVFSAYDYELYRRLHSAANPSLSLISVPVPNMVASAGPEATDATFFSLLTSIEMMTSLFRTNGEPDTRPWPNIVRLKPDFDEHKAKFFWDTATAPMNVSPHRLDFYASSASRRQDADDPDMDFLDQTLDKATDAEVVEMLQYCSLLLGGMHKLVFEKDDLAVVRDHLGRACERLIREAVFSRNISANPLLAQSLLDGILGTLSHFATHNMIIAAVTILELAWQINISNHSMVHPVTKGIVTFLSTMLAHSPNKRNLWMNRNLENFQSTTGKYFQLTISAHFTSAYFALLTNDDTTLHAHLAQLDELLAPEPEDSTAEPASPATFTSWEFNAMFDEDVPASSRLSPLPFFPASPNAPTNSMWLKPPPRFFPFGAALGTADSPPKTPNATAVSEETASTSSAQTVSEPWIVRGFNGSVQLYKPCENIKSLLRILVQLIRAEAALAYQDYHTCRDWVDEAEKTVRSLPLIYTSQKIHLLRNMFRATCPFPRGTHTIIEEFEKRMIEIDRERLQNQGPVFITPTRYML